MNITVIMPLYNPDREILEKIRKSLKNQKFKGKIKVLEVDEGLGLADSMNYGIKKAKTDIVVTLHQDCIPSSEDWLEKLVEPLKEKDVVASVSKVHLPKKFWDGFDYFAKIASVKERDVISPELDEKGCAYKKKALEKVGLFDGKSFRTAGEDYDMYIKLKKIGKIAYPKCKIFHYHKHTFKNRIKKELQLSNGSGALVRIHGKKMPSYLTRFVKAIPFLGWPLFFMNFPFHKMFFGGLIWILLSLPINILYSYGFWIGFFKGKETV